MRKDLFPSLQLAYRHWLEHDDRSRFVELAERGVIHWRSLAHEMIALHQANDAIAAEEIARLAEASRL